MKKSLLLFFSLSSLFFPNALFGSNLPSPPKTMYTRIENATIVNIIYKNGVFSIKGLTGVGNIKIYSIIGNEVASFNQVNFYDFQRSLSLDLKTMYIVRVETQGQTKIFKFVTR
ncbi:T9SS type A sorting domain-containing protein [Flavobacteriaceae bacterium]|nr:T9SS type A sorting domain-containing protein [Flavobacteriaceae bacterium]